VIVGAQDAAAAPLQRVAGLHGHDFGFPSLENGLHRHLDARIGVAKLAGGGIEGYLSQGPGIDQHPNVLGFGGSRLGLRFDDHRLLDDLFLFHNLGHFDDLGLAGCQEQPGSASPCHLQKMPTRDLSRHVMTSLAP